MEDMERCAISHMIENLLISTLNFLLWYSLDIVPSSSCLYNLIRDMFNYGHLLRAVFTMVMIFETLRDRFPSFTLSKEDRAYEIDRMYTAFLLVRLIEVPFLLWLAYSELATLYTGELTQMDVIHLLGFIVFVVGDFVRTWAKDELGRFFTYDIGIRSGHNLVTTGPYAYLAHPSYTGHALMTTGIHLYFRSILLLVISLFLAIFTSSRIMSEEDMLLKEFEREFVKYMETRWRFIPYIF